MSQRDIQYIRDKVDRIDDKLDVHIQRIAKTEQDISWLKGHVKIVTTLGITIIGAIITIILQSTN